MRWHAGWAGGVILAILALSFVAPRGSASVVPALAAGLIPSVGAFILHRHDTSQGRDLLLAVWAAAGALACGLSGGVSGPLAVWCAAPMLAAVVLGGARRMVHGAVWSLLAVSVTALAQADRLTGVTPTGVSGLGLGLIGVTSIAAGLAAALLPAHRGTARSGETSRVSPRHELLDQQPNLIVTLDRQGRIEAAFGDAFRSRVLAGGPEPVSLPALAEGAERAVLEAALATAIDQGRATGRFRLAVADQPWVAIELRRLSPTRLIAILRDASDEQARETALEQARADAEALNVGKSRFLANMSHELRTPLNAIMGFSDIMRQRIFGDLPPRYAEYADLIHDAGTHLLDLINDVLDMSKIEAARYELSLEWLDAREPVQAALRLMRLQADDAQVQLRGVLPSEPLEIDADRRALKQIVLNLVSNALKFTPQGGLVTVSLHNLAGAMELSVTDTGLGIAAEDLKRLGRPFEQAGDSPRQGRGTGLGLSLVRSFAELHGGEMVIESRLGEGTAVTVRLPMPKTEQSGPGPRQPEPVRAGVSAGANVVAFNAQR